MNTVPFQNERGMALALVLIISSVLLTYLLAGYVLIQSASKTASIELSRNQATSVALAGVEDALAWFRSTTQGKVPIKTIFDPLNVGEMRGTIQVLIPETQDSSVGIVREFPIGLNNNLFGHYEVRKSIVQDITTQRFPNSSTNGLIWYIEVNATIYKQNDASVSYNQNPNEILRTLTMGAEIRRMALTPPPAMLTTYRASNVRIQSSGEIRNDMGIAIQYWADTGSIVNNGTLVGSLQENPIDPPFDNVINAITIFGMTLSELKALIQNSPKGVYVNNSTTFSSKLVPYPSEAADPPMVYIEGSESFTSATIHLYNTTSNIPINAYGILIADKINLEILGGPSGCETDNCGRFTGLVYVTGTLHVDNGAILSGAVVSTQKDQGISGEAIQVGNSDSGAPTTRLIYNGSFISSDLNQTMGNYSISKTPYILR